MYALHTKHSSIQFMQNFICTVDWQLQHVSLASLNVLKAAVCDATHRVRPGLANAEVFLQGWCTVFCGPTSI